MFTNLTMILVIVLAILILLFVFVLLLFMPAKMCEVAKLKGYDPKSYHIFALCFWFSIFGYLYVIGLPDLKLRKILNQTLNNKQITPENNKENTEQKKREENKINILV